MPIKSQPCAETEKECSGFCKWKPGLLFLEAGVKGRMWKLCAPNSLAECTAHSTGRPKAAGGRRVPGKQTAGQAGGSAATRSSPVPFTARASLWVQGPGGEQF